MTSIVVVLILFFIVALISFKWYVSVGTPYKQYLNAFDGDYYSVKSESSSSQKFEKIIGKYRYTVAKPKFLDFTGYLTVSYLELPKVEIDPKSSEVIGSNGLYISVYIWTDVSGRYKYGVMFDDEYQGIFEQITINKNAAYLPDERNLELSEKAQQHLKENNAEIKEMLKNAIELWELE